MVAQVLIDDPKELEKIRDRESDITKERIQKVLDAGANVVLTTKGIDDMSLKYFVEAGVIACRRVPKEDLRCACIYQSHVLFCVRSLTHEEGPSMIQRVCSMNSPDLTDSCMG